MCQMLMIQIIFLKKPIVAYFTISLFTGMYQEMLIKVELYEKSFLAYISNMRLYTCMFQMMSYQVIFLENPFLQTSQTKRFLTVYVERLLSSNKILCYIVAK